MNLRNRQGMTLIELMIVVAIIGILAAIGIAYYRSQYIVKARLFEVTNSMAAVAGSVSRYYIESNVFPTAGNFAAIQSTLGVQVPADRISSMAIAGNGTQAVITATIAGIDARVDNLTLTLTAATDANGAIQWDWGGTVPPIYYPKR